MKKWLALFAVLTVVGVLVAPQWAAAYKINDQISIGLDVRWRGEMFDNVWDYNSDNGTDSWEYHRLRTRIWTDLSPIPNLHGYVRLGSEYRWGQDDETLGDVGETKDIFLDNAYIEYSNIYDKPFTLKIGRQDLMYGEGFMVLDGCPQVGSTSISFDAAKLTYTGIAKTSIDVVIAKPRENLEASADDEDLYMAYGKTQVTDSLNLEPYLMFKNRRTRQPIVAGGAVMFVRPEGHTLVLGCRGTYNTPVKDLTVVAEAAYQGRDWYPDVQPTSAPFSTDKSTWPAQLAEESRDMFGGYVRPTYTFSDAQWKPRVWGEFVYLPTHWDSMYAEWPKYSELLIYTLYDGFHLKTLANDPDEGAWVNMRILSAGVGVMPNEKTDVSVTYRRLNAITGNGPGGSSEHDRGNLVTLLATHKFNDFLNGHGLIEWFAPDDYYGSDADDALYARVELYFKY